MTDDKEPNALNPEDWAGEMGRKWLANLSLFEEMIAPIGDALLARADYHRGEAVIDLGCGGGMTSQAIAWAVAPTGTVMGLDISPDLVRAAEESAATAGMENLAFTCADAATAQLPDTPYDRMFSRFGSMFFEQPVAAFANLRGLLKQGGRIDLAVWGPPRYNLWMMEMMGVVRNHIEVPPAVPRTPGPFAFEDLDYLGEILASSGFTGMDVATYEGLQAVGGTGGTPDQAVDFAFSSMAVGRMLNEKGEAVVRAASKDLKELFARHHVPGEGVMMKAKAWLVSAIA